MLFPAGSCSGNKRPSQAGAIGLQPIGNVAPQQLAFIRGEIYHFFGRQVVLLPKINMPPAFLNRAKGERYSADSLIHFLSLRISDSISQIVGLTGKDIYTSSRDEKGAIREPRYKYEVWGIMGLGFCPGKACIVSDVRLKTNNRQLLEHRLRTVVLHEIGHNLGLPHCPNAGCIMRDANGSVANVDNSSGDYCASCRKKLKN